MAKKRKTKQEKRIADLRRQLSTQLAQAPSVQSNAYSLPTLRAKTLVSTSNVPHAKSNYAYVLSDLKKTALLTVIALAVEIILHVTLIK